MVEAVHPTSLSGPLGGLGTGGAAGAADADGSEIPALPIRTWTGTPRPPFSAGGVAGARQLYSGGTFELEDDEALVVKIDLRGTDPHYVGFHLGNLWGESADQATYVSSLSGAQLATEADGARYYVVSKRVRSRH